MTEFVRIMVGPHGKIFFIENTMGPKEMMCALIEAYAKTFGHRTQLWQIELQKFEKEGLPRNR
jgi:hypothetical protein